ncbi:hypothetical protein CDAR_459021 [Caerostris darwini]|uniref:Uncharacterized protein n=1 Tax=Caerostris darwini TaxID=1538125 RepID=A0AAV4SY99_9ARAC|nr:hypothetical protein CDAR_459021 [Caerostris darwini]
MEKAQTEKISTQQALITEAVARELEKKFLTQTDFPRTTNPGNKTFASVVAKDDNRNLAEGKTETKNHKGRAPSKNRAKLNKKDKNFVMAIKPKEASTTSAKTKTIVQAKIDVKRMNIGIKKVKPIGKWWHIGSTLGKFHH